MTNVEKYRKYRLTKETRTLEDGTVLRRIRATRDFILTDHSVVHKGNFGGWIEKEDNLSHCERAWVSCEACVYGNARVCENAYVGGGARVYENATVYGDAYVADNARVYDRAKISGNAHVYGFAHVCGTSNVFGCSKVSGGSIVWGSASVHGYAHVSDNANIFGNANVYGSADVYGNARVYEHAKVYGNSLIYENAAVLGDVSVCGFVEICGDAKVSSMRDYATYKNTWSSGRYFTYTRSNKKWKVGCFFGTGEELIEKAYKDSKLSGKCYETIVRTQESIDKMVSKEKYHDSVGSFRRREREGSK